MSFGPAGTLAAQLHAEKINVVLFYCLLGFVAGALHQSMGGFRATAGGKAMQQQFWFICCAECLCWRQGEGTSRWEVKEVPHATSLIAEKEIFCNMRGRPKRAAKVGRKVASEEGGKALLSNLCWPASCICRSAGDGKWWPDEERSL